MKESKRIVNSVCAFLALFFIFTCHSLDMHSQEANDHGKQTTLLADAVSFKVKNTYTHFSVSDDLENPASHIYDSWKNSGIKNISGILPKNYRIDLRGFVMPTTHRYITSEYGMRWNRKHNGIDVKVYMGDTIRSAFSGKVRIAGYEKAGYGYYVVIRHPNGLETIYAHLSKIKVKQNQVVYAGECIGLGGSTGRSTGSHLHFECRILGIPINPSKLFDFANQDVTDDFYTVAN